MAPSFRIQDERPNTDKALLPQVTSPNRPIPCFDGPNKALGDKETGIFDRCADRGGGPSSPRDW